MSDAAHTADLPPPSRSGRLLSLVRMLWDYGVQLSASLRQRHPANDQAGLRRAFGTTDIVVILTRIALGMQRAKLLGEKIALTAARIDVGSQPAPAPTSSEPRAVPSPVQPRAPRREHEPRPTDTVSLLVRLPNFSRIAIRVRRQPIGVILADICRDLGISRGHPLWDELRAAITEFGGSLIGLVRARLNQAFFVGHVAGRLKTRPEAPPEPESTGPPLAVPA